MISLDGTSGIDPAWAWSAYVPDKQRPWDLCRAAHLYRRAAFGASWDQLQRALRDGPERAVGRLLRPEGDVAAFQTTFDTYEDESIDPGSIKADTFRDWWLRRMIQTPHPLLEKMTLFWHGHFATRNFAAKSGRLMARYVRTLRGHALGSFQTLLGAALADPAVRLSYNANVNRRGMPEPGFARALLDRFTLGPGVAAERDVRETARALSGLTVLRNQSRFLVHNHDKGAKTILGAKGDWTVDDVVRLSAGNPATARHLSRLVYRWFISEADEPADALLDPLAAAFGREGNIGTMVETVLRSNLFFSEYAYRRRIKSPVEFALGMVCGLGGLVPTSRLNVDLAALGQDLAEPPTSAGWQGGTAWINSATIVGRANLAAELLSADGAYGAGLDPRRAVSTRGPEKIDRTGTRLVELFLQGDVPAPVKKILAAPVSAGRTDALRLIAHRIVTLPEYQLA